MPSDELMLSAGAVEITPQHPVPLAGFGDRTGAFTHVAAPLEVNIIVLHCHAQATVLVSVDTLFCTDTLREELAEVCRKHGEPRATIILGATHTHFAPACDPDKPLLGPCDPHYVQWVTHRMRRLLAHLLEETGEPVVLGYGQATFARVINRRRSGWGRQRGGFLPRRRTIMAPNPRGAADRTIHALGLWDSSGQLRSCLWVVGCHPVGAPQYRAVHPDFPGVVRDRLRQTYGRRNLPVVFLQGFSGNVRPNQVESISLAQLIAKLVRGPGAWREHVRGWLNGTQFGTFSEEQYAAWTGDLATCVEHAIDISRRRLVVADLSGSVQTMPLNSLIAGDVADRTWSLQSLHMGANLSLIAVSAEVVAEYVALLEDAAPGRQFIPVSCVGGIFGYLPTDTMLDEGGYEAIDHLPYFNISGRFKDHPERTWLRQVAALFTRAAAAA
jgi:hypothetical protein